LKLATGDFAMTTKATVLILGLIFLAVGGGYVADHARRLPVRNDVEAEPQQKPVKTDQEAKPAQLSEDILASAKSYVEAFNRQDSKAIVALCTEDCEFIDRDGLTLHGPQEIEKELKKDFTDNPKARISLSVESVRMLTPDVAIEQGKMVYFPDGVKATVETKYDVTHVKQGNRWLMAQGRSYDAEILSPYEYLRELDWLVGDWLDEGPGSVVETSYRWTEDKAFLLQEFTVRAKGKKVLSGSQRIGWDPLSKQIKSWVFDSEGGYGESYWSRVDDSWVSQARAVRLDGKVATATNRITRTGDDRMVYQSVDRIVGEERMPNVSVTIVRQPPQPKKN
jgi:uncharacterized protein (TIGR02246 family)